MNKKENVNPINILSDIIIYGKYARYLPKLNRRETWEEIVMRNMNMHLKKYPHIEDEILEAYSYVLDKKVFPSMRALQFSGLPIELSPNRLFNCSYLTCNNIAAFSETMFLLLGGSGVGFSVQKHHIDELPDLQGPKTRKRRYLINDSIEGWSESIKLLMASYFHHKSRIEFDYRDIRKKGSLLVTSGGKAPGPKPLKDCINLITSKLDEILEDRGSGTRLKPIEVHDIQCQIADAVLAGGIRRAALISLFSFNDTDMLNAKTGQWWEKNPQRGRANNSIVLVRHKITKADFFRIWERVKASNAGEPGIFLTNDKSMGCNPCVEASLKDKSFCNLATINVSDINTQDELNKLVIAATVIGTLQAGYTNFHYIRDAWKRNTEKEALLGISMTGIGSGNVLKLDIEESSKLAVKTNKRIAKLININSAYRITCVKPEGTSSLVAGTSSGIHAWHNDYYKRNIKLGKDESLYKYLIKKIPMLIEDDFEKPDKNAVLGIPIKAPKGAILRSENPIDLLKRVKQFHDKWIKPAHIKGSNTNNVSVTVNIKKNEWDIVGDWMWENRDSYNGISVFPYDGGTYKQPPFCDITKEKYEELLQYVNKIDLTEVKEKHDTTDHSGEIACGGNGGCDVTKV